MTADQPFPCITIGSAIESNDVVFVVQAGYHLDDAIAVTRELAQEGLSVGLVAPVPRTGLLSRWRSSAMRFAEIQRSVASAGLEFGSEISALQVVQRSRLIVVRNDWGPSRHLVEMARTADVTTVGWVEGVQDFDDVDTGQHRNPYGTVDHVLTLGEYDRGVLGSRAVTSQVGSERIYRLWHGPATTGTLGSIANVNFTYGVRSAARRAWVGDVLKASRAAGVPLGITRHPVDRGLRGRRSEVPGGGSLLLPQSARLISRFSTLIYEALAVGVDVAHYNPHGEMVPTFNDPKGAFTLVRDSESLTRWLQQPLKTPEEVRHNAEQFLAHHVTIVGPRPAERASAVLRSLLDATPG